MIPLSSPPTVGHVQSPPTATEEAHTQILSAFVDSWNAANTPAVLRLFAPNAIVGDAWASWSSHEALSYWIDQELRDGTILTAHLESANGPHARWRLSRTTALDRRFALPPLERWADVELHDGVITSLSFRSDPRSRESYTSAVSALAAQRLAPGAANHPGSPAPTRAVQLPLQTTGWLAAAFARLLVSTLASVTRSNR